MATKKIVFTIEGMHCGSCAVGIQMVLESSDGVVKASADYEKKKGEVEFDDEKTKWEDLKKAVEEMGYKISVVMAHENA